MKVLDRHPPVEAAATGPEAEALFPEAKRRERHRRLLWLGVIVIVLGAAAGIFQAVGGGSADKRPLSKKSSQIKSPAATPGSGKKSSSQSLRTVLTAKFRPAGGIYGVATGDDATWATTGSSLIRIDLASDRTATLLSFPAASLATVVYGAASLWVTDNAGIIRVDPKTGKVTGTVRITTSSLTYGEGALWAIDRAGLTRINPRTLAVRTFLLPFGKRFGMAAGEDAVWVSVVADHCSRGCLLRIDPSSGRIVARVEGEHLVGSVATGDGAVWASDGTSVVRIDSKTNRIVTTLALVPAPSGSGESRTFYGSGLLAIAPGAVWVTKTINGQDARLVQIDPLDNRVGRGTAVGPYPSAIAAAGRTVWVASEKGALTRIDLVSCGPKRCRAAAPPSSEPSPPTPMWFQSLQMVSPQTGWAIRWTQNPGVLDSATPVPTRTTDGGRTWTDVTPAAARPLLTPNTGWTLFALNADRGSLDFVDPSHGWLVEELGAAMGSDAEAILRTTDGGMKWSLVARTPSLLGSRPGVGGLPLSCAKSLSFATPSLGWVSGTCNGGGTFFYATRNGGQTWEAQSLPVSVASCDGCDVSPPVFFSRTGFLTVHTGSGSILLVSHDTGATWSRLQLPSKVGKSPTIQFVDARHGFLVPGGYAGSIGQVLYATANAGQTWTRIRSDVGFNQLGTLDFVSAEVGVAWFGGEVLGVPPMYGTSKGGRTWTRFTPRLGMPPQRN
jgi:photosystem II stability/assembly factor-like uncharacterized protein